MTTQTLKGFRDFLPSEVRKRQYVLSVLKDTFELYGFSPLETPTLEYEEVLINKYGEEGDKLMYRFTDNGNRRVALRYDQTVPLSRVIVQHRNDLTFPFKRYQIQNVFRADNTQKGRFREFLQCDIDIVGSDSDLADAEILSLIYSSFIKLGFKKFKIQTNDRSVFKDLSSKAIRIIDKLEKQGRDAVIKELNENDFDSNIIENLEKTEIPKSIQEIKNFAVKLGADENFIEFNPLLARGLDYYTGLIIEVSIDEYSSGSVGGGGRYDKLLGMFSGSDTPAVGFAFGFDRIIECMQEQNLFPKNLDTKSTLVTVFNKDFAQDSIEAVKFLRNNSVQAELWYDTNLTLEKQLRYADRNSFKYALILGPDEKANNTVTLKNLKDKTQVTKTLMELLDLFKNNTA